MAFEKQCLEAIKANGMDLRDPVSTKSIRIINRLARQSDDSHLWPFIPSAERAIRWYSRVYFPANGPCSILEYILGLESKMIDIVNGRA